MQLGTANEIRIKQAAIDSDKGKLTTAWACFCSGCDHDMTCESIGCS